MEIRCHARDGGDNAEMLMLEENVNLHGLVWLLPAMLLIAGLLALAGTLTPPIPSQHLNNHIPAITAKLRPARPALHHRGKYVLSGQE